MQDNEHRGRLKTTFEEFGATPSAELWAKVEGELNHEEKKRGVIWWWAGAGLAAAVAVIFLVANVELTATSPTIFTHKSTNASNVQKNHLYTPRLNEKTVAETTVVLNKETTNTNAQRDDSSNKNQNEKLPKTDGEGSADVVKKDGEGVVKSSTKSSTKTKKQTPKLRPSTEIPLLVLTEVVPLENGMLQAFSAGNLIPIQPEVVYQPKWEIGVSAGYITGVSEDDLTSNGDNALVEATDSYSGTPITLNELLPFNSETTTKISRSPSIDFSVNYALKPRFRIGTGWQFARINYNEKVIVNAGNNYYELNSKLSTLAIPIHLQYSFTQNARWNFAGGISYINEFPYRVKTDYTYYDLFTENNFDLESKSEKVAGKTYLGALELNLAASYNFTPRLRLVAAPVARYYTFVKADSQPYLSQKKWWLGGKVGLFWLLK